RSGTLGVLGPRTDGATWVTVAPHPWRWRDGCVKRHPALTSRGSHVTAVLRAPGEYGARRAPRCRWNRGSLPRPGRRFTYNGGTSRQEVPNACPSDGQTTASRQGLRHLVGRP